MKRSCAVTLAVLSCLFGHIRPSQAQRPPSESATPQNGETITLAIGETHMVSAKDVKNYSEGVSGIIDVKLTTDSSSFVIAGRKPGSTTLLLIKNDGAQITLNIDVFVRSPQAVEHELTQLLDGLPNVHVRRVGAHIVIDGLVANDAELKRVQHVASLYPGQVDSLVSTGSAGTSGPVLGQELARIVIRIDFYFVQYDMDATYAVGIGWPGSIGGAAIQSTFTYDFLDGVAHTATTTLSNQPLPRLDIASTRGWAKVLKHTTVVTNNGVEANFQNGGEQNFTVTTGLGVGVQKIPYGTEVTVLPKYDPSHREIDVKISADVADLTASVSGTTLPGRTTSKLSTNVTLQLGESLVLSGIHRESTNHTVTGLPVLKDIPILGLLFGSHSDDTQATEGAVFIVPSVMQDGVPKATLELIDGALRRFREYRGNADAVHAYDPNPGGGSLLSPAKN
jgi:pilus assembly protein CpaC